MSSGLLEFFSLEASEYVEHLDVLLAKARGAPPDFDACVRYARALRGSATMARASGIADIAGAVERLAQALQRGSLAWSDDFHGAIVAAIDDLKFLIRRVRAWSSADAERAAARTRALSVFAPASASAAAAMPIASGFLAAEAAAISRALMAFAENPGGPAAFAGTLRRVRALRGISQLKELPPLGDVVDALDQAGASLELGGAVTPAIRTLIHTAAVVLADASLALSRGDHPSLASDALAAFSEAAAATRGSRAADYVVAISALYPEDGAPGLVSAAPSPPTRAAQRFRFEVVSHAEHLRQLIADAGRAPDGTTRERLARELGAATHALAQFAASFGEGRLAAFFGEQQAQAVLLAGSALDALDRACRLLLAPHGQSTDEIVRTVQGDRNPPTTPAVSPAQPAAVTPVALPATVSVASFAADAKPSLSGRVPSVAGLSGDALSTMLSNGLAGLSRLADVPLAASVETMSDMVVPIEDLVYRGRDALDRAIELRDLIRKSPSVPDPAMLSELFDLLELAATSD